MSDSPTASIKSRKKSFKNILEPVYKWFLRESYYRRDKPLSAESCWSDLLLLELLLGFGVVEYFGGYLMKRRSSSFLIHLRSLVIAVMAQALVTRGLKQVYSSNLLVTWRGEGNSEKHHNVASQKLSPHL